MTDHNVITVPEDTAPETVNDLVKDGWIVRLVHRKGEDEDMSTMQNRETD